MIFPGDLAKMAFPWAIQVIRVVPATWELEDELVFAMDDLE